MNKYITLGIVVAVILIGGIGYKIFLAPQPENPPSTQTQTPVKEFTIIAKKGRYEFIPGNVQVNLGDRVALTVVNEDDYDHGLAIDQFGVSQRMPARSTIKIEFIAIKRGEFQYYCSVPCGEGEVDGYKRGHLDMIGTIKVN